MGLLDQKKHSPKELQAILGCFSLEKGNYRFRPITQGYINDTFLVIKDEKPIFILQRINHQVFKDVDGLMQNVSRALKSLHGSDYQVIQLVKTMDGKTHCQKDHGFWRLMEYVDDTHTFNITYETHISYEAGRIIGKFHVLMQHENVEHYHCTIPNFHNLDFRLTQYREALSKTTKDRMQTARPAIDKVEGLADYLKKMPLSSLPKRVCHNDTKLNNILFSKSTNKALCLIDLDTIMAGYFLYDFGDAMRIIANTALEDEKDLGKIHFHQERFSAFVYGLKENSSFLTPHEIASLHYGTILMPFLHGIRALSDFLNFDAYYKIAYPAQNLDRALSLLQFAEKAMENEAFMKNTIQSTL